ncbi:hypothetical protein [Roseivirga thermotolerans]|uniref:Toprim domain-containing protein n=1 Tax=Roseivirga thermotolerans TaxID=1758176 RepID=A0ABQ3I8R0_9BACT|nr:hypothetical protein [Roseivirga thermotolerans]GHE65172.1 hypothetical protein GCM10011340_20310 [Roseivirga thermotolerans]
MPYFEHDEILKRTNGGLDIIIHLCPAAAKCVGNNRHFKLREDENTPSTSIKQMPDGNWIATDWGGSGKSADSEKRNAIQLWQHVKGVDYKTALEQIAIQWGIMPEEQLKQVRKPDFNSRDAKPDEKEGTYTFDFYKLEEMPKEWLSVLGPYAKIEKMAYYHWHAVKSYSMVKNGKVMTWNSRENYPILVIHEEGFKKIYQPLAFEKKDRFRYAVDSEKDTNFIHGLAQAKKWYLDNNKWEAPDYKETEEDAESKEDRKETKIPELIICSGDRDALNVAGMGYFVVWKNSESAKITGKQMMDMQKYAEKIYNLPDIDNTGIIQGHKLAMIYMDIHTIWLPAELRNAKDWRGNPRKDLLDFCEWKRDRASSEFKQLLRISYPMKFWDSYVNKNGKITYEVRDTYMFNFLSRNGYYIYRKEGVKEDFIFIHVDGNIVAEVNAIDVKKFVIRFLFERREDIKLRDFFLRTPRLNPSALTDLHETELDFRSYFKDGRIYFFSNGAFMVSADGIEKLKPGTIDKYVWEEKVLKNGLKKGFQIEKPFFKVTHFLDEDGKQVIEDLEILNDDCEFFRYLIQTSRVHWQAELEDRLDNLPPKERRAYLEKYKFSIEGPNLEAEEIREQKLQLLNKMYVIGYVMHRNRKRSRPWVPLAMDYRLSDANKSFGGSGKSMIFETGLFAMSRMVKINGKDKKLWTQEHLFTEVTKDTDFILFDDLDEYFDFRMLFTYTSGSFSVNPKFGKRFTMSNDEAPLIVGTTNYGLRDTTPSIRRRLFPMLFSDYYHLAGDGYREHREINAEFGHDILDEDTTPEEWNRFYNFMMQCLQLYLQLPKPVYPPMSQMELRNLRSKMGDTFFYWAEVFFSPAGDNLNKELVKAEVMEEYQKEVGGKFKLSSQGFKDKLEAYCMYSNLTYNPLPTDERNNRIIRLHNGKTTEMIFVATEDWMANEDKRQADQEIDNNLKQISDEF